MTRMVRNGRRMWMRAIGLCALLATVPAWGAVYQWSTTFDDVVSSETKDHPRAFLWIPENCRRVRAVVIADQNMEEEQLFQNAEFRKTLADLGFAEIWMAPPMGSNHFRYDQGGGGDGERLEKMLKTFADQSGYAELADAPLVPTGHSATASWCWDVAAWRPERVLAVLSLSGQWPYFESDFRADRSVDGVPGLTTKGEYEIRGNLEKGWYAGLKGDYYQKHANAAFTQIVEPGDGHFSASKEKIALIDLYLRKAARYRLPREMPESGPVTLRPIDAGKEGWRYEVWHVNAPPSAPAAPVGAYKGALDRSFWAFDEELATAIEAFQGKCRGKRTVLIGYHQKDGLTAPTPDHAMVHLKFEPTDDGLTFTVSGAFWDRVPAAKDQKVTEWQEWLGEGLRTVAQNEAIPHPAGEEGDMTIEPICGPVEQKDAHTFAIRFNRVGMGSPKRSNDIWLVLTYPGDATYKRMVQQAELRFPLVNKEGTPQTIEFPEIPDQPAGESKPVQLHATSSAGLPVHYYVRQGPAEVDDSGKLTLTPIPPRTKFPIPVTVVAWQWGRSVAPLVQSARPVEHTFRVTNP